MSEIYSQDRPGPLDDQNMIKGKSALIIVDVQRGFAEPGCGLSKDPENDQFYYNAVKEQVLPNIAKMIAACEKVNCEVIWLRAQTLTKDGRESSPLYKSMGVLWPPGSKEADIMPEIAPKDPDNAIIINKTATGVFNSTNIEYILRNIGVTHVTVCGLVSNICVENCVRDASDRGFKVTLISDAIATYNKQLTDAALLCMKMYARIVTHEVIIEELEDWEPCKRA